MLLYYGLGYGYGGYGYGYGYGGYGYGSGLYGLTWSWTYLLIIAGVIICMVASARMRNTFNKYAKVRSMSGMTGAQAAEKILKSQGINDVKITHVSGSLTDHYNPTNRTLALSDSSFQSTSVAAVGVAAHECGHAIQHHKHYVPLRIRGSLVPVTRVTSVLAWPLIIFGMFLTGTNSLLMDIGIILFSFSVVFQLVTLPVEFNASHRAMKVLESTQILQSQELVYTRKVLTAAAMTYVASAAAIILQLLRVLLIAGRRR
ncbi:MAG: zinc metallopeptidase [Lachnospiraceae bacterium]|nr:zinc metallopeptidase [Lachnospiraceae bacterium]